MGTMDKVKFKVRKFLAKFKVRRILKKDAAAASHVAHEERLAQVHRVEGTEHRIERSMDVMVAARRSVYGANMLPRTTEFGVTVEEARELHEKQKAHDATKAAAAEDAAAQDGGGIWDGSAPGNNKLI
ncbi:mei2-like protein [Fusarium mundagurra]|uniref:Mei2-like protein n=1 Tax=Fusarium mundagurra TaxID=1567541 RepID=A0A8H6DK15_9HYPO|nr:mei2-like protein [Fusarium mundagurra]